MSPGRRLHPAGIAVLALRALRGAALPALLGLTATVTGGGLDAQALARGAGFALLAACAATLFGYLTWRTARYDVSEAAIVSRRGVLRLRETVVPLERVQALDTVQGPLQRLFKVTAVHVQAAGGGREGEIVLEALSPAALAELRALIGRRAAPEAPAGRVRRLGPRRLLLGALTSGGLGVIAPALVGVSQMLDDLIGEDPARLAERAGLLPDSTAELLLAGAVLILLAWSLSIAGSIVAFAGFTVTRDGDRLLVRRGLLARREASVPLARIQAVTVLEGVLRQPFGLAALRVEVVGYAAEAGAAQTLFPLLRRGEVAPFLAEMAPAFADDARRLEGPPRRALRRYLLPPAALAALPAAGLVAAGLAPWAAVPLLLGLAKGVADYSAEGVRLEPGLVVVSFRRIARRSVIVARRRVQKHELLQNPLQARAHLARLRVAAGAGTSAGVAHLDARVARELFEAM